jgi:hypothetical protein
VEFPGRLLVLTAVAGIVSGGVGGALFRLIRGAMIPGAAFDVLAASPNRALPGDLGSRWKVGLVAAVSLGHINGCRGCVGTDHLGADGAVSGCALGFTEGIGLGVAIFLFMLLRPGVVERDRSRAVVYDVLFGLAAIALFASSSLGELLVKSLLYLDVGAMSVAAAFGSSGPFSERAVAVAYLVVGAYVGLLLGLRRALASVGRPLLAYAQLTGGVALLLILASARGTAAGIQGKGALFAPSEASCAAAVEHAARVSYAEEARPVAPTFDVFRTSAGYKTESEEANRRCRTARREAVECVANATSRAAMAACGPFWMGE